jgi:hypothetical protein
MGSPLDVLEQIVGYENNPTHSLPGPVGPKEPFVQLDPAVRHVHEGRRVNDVRALLPNQPT